MAKQVNSTGYSVTVEPDIGSMYRPYFGDEKAVEKEREICEEMVEQIKRHVDNVKWVNVVEEAEAVCEHCGSAWTEDSADYNGGCCDEDQDAHEAINPKGV